MERGKRRKRGLAPLLNSRFRVAILLLFSLHYPRRRILKELCPLALLGMGY